MMNQIPDERQVIEAMQQFSPNLSQRLDRRLATAPWTPGAILRRRLAGLTACIMLVLALVTFGTPQGRAMAQNLLLFFVRSDSETIALPTAESNLAPVTSEILQNIPPSEPGAQQCGTVLAPRCSLSQVQEQANFPVRGLDVSGKQLQFVGAAHTEQGVIALRYEGQDGVVNLAQIPARQDEIKKWRIGPSTTVETVAIGDVVGEYVRGGWFGLGLKEGTVGWVEESALQTLRWEKDGLQFTLWYAAARSANGIPALDSSDLVVLAASLTDRNEAQVTPDSEDLTPQQASELTGFDIKEPRALPVGLSYSGSAYSSKFNAVCLFYSYQAHGVTPALALFQTSWDMPRLDEFQVSAEFNGQSVEIAAEVENIQLAGAAGESATLVTTGLETGKICNGKQAQVNRALLWHSNGRNFILFAPLDQLDGRGYLSKLEMRRLAESLNRMESGSVNEIDPERMLSIEAAEAFLGMDLKSPALMLDDLHLNHIAYQNYGPYQGSQGEIMVAMLYSGAAVGDGRTYKSLVMQIVHPENTLEELALAGGYEPARVGGQPAIYRQDCWESADLAGGTGCHQHLAWFAGAVRYEIETFLPASLPEETLIEIAESMQ